MLTADSVDKLKDLIEVSGGSDQDKQGLREALDDVARLVGTQALMIRNMKIDLDNANVGLQSIQAIADGNTLANLFAHMGVAKRNQFGANEAVAANDMLVARVSQATDFADIFKAVVDVAKVFI